MKIINIFVPFLLSIGSVSAHQMMALNITKQNMSLTNSSVRKKDDLTLCVRFFVEPSSQRREIFKHGPLSLGSSFDYIHPVDQMNGYVGYELPNSINPSRKSFPFWAPKVWNHICLTFADMDCGVSVVLNGHIVLETRMDPCYGNYENGSLVLGQNQIVTDINVWDKVISKEEAKAWTNCESIKTGSVFAWSDMKWKDILNKFWVARKEVCRKCCKAIGYELPMSFEKSIEFCRLLGGRMATFGDISTIESINQTLLTEPISPKLVHTGYVLEGNKTPVNIYTGL